MVSFPLTDEDVSLLNTPLGLKFLFSQKRLDVERALRWTRYENTLRDLQANLIKAQDWVIAGGKRVVVICEGRDAAGKGGAIRRMTAHINPRHYRIVALSKPSEQERGQWYFQRYVNCLPQPGQIVFFDRSWYNRAVVEPVNGFCTQGEYDSFMEHVNQFEKMIVDSGTYLIKLYFSIAKGEQASRFAEIMASPLKRWKMTAVDERAQELWDSYTEYKEVMFEKTNTEYSPWTILDANRKTVARREAIEHILSVLPYE
ncbi:MAG: polyphosphate kinase 2 [Rhodothermales bacterium]|jgi:polyphosphate kinase 2